MRRQATATSDRTTRDPGQPVARLHCYRAGVPPGAAESIFEDGWSTRPDRGTARRGLGLALVHRLAQRHGGTATVSEGPGAVFTVALPLPDATPVSMDAQFTMASPARGVRG
ncbi:ATP-binding protein [Streptomyces qaidamensis]|uniref:ATP-binding protein n=1 Tax=Streptomyces qaidamensis TaxID=1783515 RepID=UPI0009A0509A